MEKGQERARCLLRDLERAYDRAAARIKETTQANDMRPVDAVGDKILGEASHITLKRSLQ